MHLTDAALKEFDKSGYLFVPIRAFNREEWIAQRDFAPIESLDHDCLAQLADETFSATA